ncbi:hypothetical protein CH75_04860 [Dyella jiangningensis]|nr:hypothetical protein CH75_04860 [Dyella jiangningensis]
MSDGARVGANDGSNPSNVGAIPTAPAIEAKKERARKLFSVLAKADFSAESQLPIYINRDIYVDDFTGI